MSTQARTKRGTFKKGTSGNPSGRPKSENAILRQRLSEHGEKVVAAVVEAALRGDMQAAKIVLERLCPPLKPSTAPITVDLPEDAGLAGTARAFVEAAAQGRLPADVALTLVQAVAGLTRIVEIDEIEKRLSALEASR